MAERSLRKVQVTVDEGAFRPQRNLGVAAWGEQWIASLERKETTVDSYRATIAHARMTIGHKRVRDLRADDVGQLSSALREQGLSPSTRAKHLRVLHACLEAAVRHDYAARNPVSDLAPGQRPRAVLHTYSQEPRLSIANQ